MILSEWLIVKTDWWALNEHIFSNSEYLSKDTLKDFSFWAGCMLHLVKRNCTGNMDLLGSHTSNKDLYVFYGERTVQCLWSVRHCLISSKLFVNTPLFYFYTFKHKMQSRTPKFSVFIFHSFMVCSCASNLIAYGFNFFVNKIGIFRHSEDFWVVQVGYRLVF